ncbi:hypothetical protein LTR78_005432 [Recurvomyces mirabilis]|uniref:Uncharacterized protein n=1 Tax=Recurvomyces mirabilis TaxID=574656 RepID=A0AAE1C1F2_9PEZI|nr:hypothetical protein LTR78_005432 [Recurvomyces mirabilis]KAK5152662.1 hypothetical protein LTS14_008196 [Recurvomyces mirabilis]
MPFLEVLCTVYGYLLAAKLFGTKQAENAFNYVFGIFAPTISASPFASSASNVSNSSSPYGITLFGSNGTTSTIAGLLDHVTKVTIPTLAPLTPTSALPARRHYPTANENHLSKCIALHGSCELVTVEENDTTSGYGFAGHYDRTTVMVGFTLATLLLLVALFARSQAQHKEREQAYVALLASQQVMAMEITSLERDKETYRDLARAANGIRLEAQTQQKASNEALQQTEKKMEDLKQANRDIDILKNAFDRDLEQAEKEAQGLKQALEEYLKQASTKIEDLGRAFEADLEQSRKNIKEAKQKFDKEPEQSREETRKAKHARYNAIDQAKKKDKGLKQASAATEQAVKEARELKKSFGMAEQEVEDLKQASAVTEQAMKEARELKKSCDEELKQAKAEIEDLRQKIATNQTESRDAIIEVKQTADIELAKATSEADQLRDDLDALQHENERVEDEIEADIDEHDKAMEQQASIVNDALKNATLEQAKQIMKGSYEQQMRQKNFDHVQNMAAAEEEKMEIWNQVPEIVDEATAELEEDVKGLTLENKTLRDHVDELQRSRDACRCGSSGSETLDDNDHDDVQDGSDDDKDEDDRKDEDDDPADSNNDDDHGIEAHAPTDGHADDDNPENTDTAFPEDVHGSSSGTDSNEVEAHSEERVQDDYEVGSPRNDEDDVSVFDARSATYPQVNLSELRSYEMNKETKDEDVAGVSDLPPTKDKTGSKKPGRIYGDACKRMARMVEAYEIPIRPPYYQERVADWTMSKPLYESVVGSVIVSLPKAPDMAMVNPPPPRGLMASRWAR